MPLDDYAIENLALMLVLICGIANFALHRAVLARPYPALLAMPWVRRLLGKPSLMLEFGVLAGAALAAGYDHTGWALAYAGYTALNAVSAWWILTRRT